MHKFSSLGFLRPHLHVCIVHPVSIYKKLSYSLKKYHTFSSVSLALDG